MDVPKCPVCCRRDEDCMKVRYISSNPNACSTQLELPLYQRSLVPKIKQATAWWSEEMYVE